jgi:hypothetical protein
MVPPASCSLDAAGAAAQGERYRRAGAGASVAERSARRLVVQLGAAADLDALDAAIAVEAECCPFFDLGLERDARRLTVAVDDDEHAPALDAIVHALGLTRC